MALQPAPQLAKGLKTCSPEGLSKDEIALYEDALRHGRTVIIVLSEDDDLLAQSRQIMEKSGAESLDAAREKWWVGLRDSESDPVPPKTQ